MKRLLAEITRSSLDTLLGLGIIGTFLTMLIVAINVL